MSKQPMPYMYFNQTIIPSAEAKVGIACNSLQYGTTCFAGVRGYTREGHYMVFRLRDHFERLLQGGKVLGMNFKCSYTNFENIIEELIQKNAPQENFYIRPFLFSADEQLSPKPKGLTFQLGIYLVPLGHYFKPEQGLRLMISSWRKFSDAALPTKAKAGGCYVNSFLATGEAERSGYDEALMMDDQGFIVEASVANLLVVRRGQIYSPPAGSAMLEGITWRTVLECLKDLKHEVHFHVLDRSFIYTADEIILLGTAAQITFASSIDRRSIGKNKGPGPITLLLRNEFKKIFELNHPKSKTWLKFIPRKMLCN